MPNVNEIWEYINTFAPRELAEEWDNVGVLVQGQQEAGKILVTLDITREVVQEAAERGCGTIVAHHPVIFKPLRSLRHDDVVFLLAKAGISAVCAHTNLDAAQGGVNDVLAEIFGLSQVEAFAGLGRVGNLPAQTTAHEVAAMCTQKLGGHVRLAHAGKPVQRLAVVGGAGGDCLPAALAAGADMLVTGDAGHHDGLDALHAGLSLAVAGHYATEFPVVPVLAQKLAEHFTGTEVLVTGANKDPFQYLP